MPLKHRKKRAKHLKNRNIFRKQKTNPHGLQDAVRLSLKRRLTPKNAPVEELLSKWQNKCVLVPRCERVIQATAINSMHAKQAIFK